MQVQNLYKFSVFFLQSEFLITSWKQIDFSENFFGSNFVDENWECLKIMLENINFVAIRF
jgi:hypothetical protein